MKILYLTQFNPLDMDNGGTIKTAETLERLVKEKNEVILFCYEKNGDLAYLKKCRDLLIKKKVKVGAIVVNKNFLNEDIGYNVGSFIKSLITVIPFSAYRFSTEELKEKIDFFLKRESIDCFWVDSFTMAHLLPKNFTGKTVLESHNVESLFFKEMFLKDQLLFYKLFALHEWIKYKIYERIYYPRFQQIIAISETDQKNLQRIAKVRNIVVIRPKIKTRIISTKEKIPLSLLFIGSLYWYPNRDGLAWFLQNVYPLLLKELPQIKFFVVGKHPKEFKFPNLKGVVFTGYQKKVDRYFQNSELLVVPIRYGSGIRIKILEAVSYHLPVITTFKGAEGLSPSFRKKYNITPVDSPLKMTDAIVKFFESRRNVI